MKKFSALLCCVFSLSAVALSSVSTSLPLGTAVVYAQDDGLGTWAEFAFNQNTKRKN